MKITPNYTIVDTVGKSGKFLWSKNLWPFRVSCYTPQTVAFHTEPEFKGFNPFTGLQHGALALAWGSDNLFVSFAGWRVIK